MPFTLSEVVPWGRSYDEYVSMFSLSPLDLKQKILGCGDGPASFNSILSSRGGTVVSIDPAYSYSAAIIKRRIDETYDVVLEQTRKNKKEFIWETITSVEELGSIRMAAMTTFLKDYETGKKEGRYIAGELPQLPFYDKEFYLALCSHFLFLYSKQLSEEFHFTSIKELCRVAQEVRIFPVLELNPIKSRHLENVTAKLERELYDVKIKIVPYQFQKGGNEMLIIKSPNNAAHESTRTVSYQKSRALIGNNRDKSHSLEPVEALVAC